MDALALVTGVRPVFPDAPAGDPRGAIERPAHLARTDFLTCLEDPSGNPRASASAAAT